MHAGFWHKRSCESCVGSKLDCNGSLKPRGAVACFQRDLVAKTTLELHACSVVMHAFDNMYATHERSDVHHGGL